MRLIGCSRCKAVIPNIARLILGFCISFATVELAMAQAQPHSALAPLLATEHEPRNMTRALRCVDGLLAARAPRTITLTWAGVEDETGKVIAGSKEMMITAMAKMSVKSNAFKFHDSYHGPIANRANSLEYLFHSSRKVDQPAESIEYRVISAYQIDKSAGSINLHMHIEEFATGKPVLAAVSSNSMRIPASGTQEGDRQDRTRLDAAPTIDSPRPTRAMIDLTLLETLGKLTELPFRQCLE